MPTYKMPRVLHNYIPFQDALPLYKRPWQSTVPPLEESVEEVIPFPSDDEEHGMVRVAWRTAKAQVHTFNPFHSGYAFARISPFPSGYACRRSQRTWWLHLVFIETVCTRSNFYHFPHNAKGLHFRLAPFVFV